jgi:cytosine/adenosine deaminase-related metal-dependent hydrolase
MQVYRAAWVLPIDRPPIRDGWVSVDHGAIAGLGVWGQTPRAGSEQRGLTPVAILPGLVNAHTHLELSWMRGMIPPAEAMPAWAAKLIGIRRATAGDAVAPIVDAIAEARACGTALVGDVTNSLAAYEPLRHSALSAVVFYELLGFNPADAAARVADANHRVAALTPHGPIRVALAPHAPYSVSRELFQAIAADGNGRPISVHLGESAEEVRFLSDGGGAWRELLERIGAWTPGWSAPACGPVEYLQRIGLLNDRLVAVHGAQLADEALGALRDAAATLVTCPRSNRWTGAGTPPIARFYGSGVRVAIGTDSLASVEDLNVFAEMAAVRALAPDVPASRILRSATLDGAVALGFGAELGSIAPGKRAELLAVTIPPALIDSEDVEEYLVGGVRPDQIRWLTE